MKLASIRQLQPRFGLRTLLVIVMVICAAMAWVQSQRRWIHERHEIVARYRVKSHTLSGERSNWGAPEKRYGSGYEVRRFEILHGPRPAAPWQLRWFGEKGYFEVMLSEELPDQEFQRIQRLFPESNVTRVWANESSARHSHRDEAEIRETLRSQEH